LGLPVVPDVNIKQAKVSGVIVAVASSSFELSDAFISLPFSINS